MTVPETFNSLECFAAWPSDDELKTDLELACTLCGEVLCDIEANDTLDVLARTALEHAADHHLTV